MGELPEVQDGWIQEQSPVKLEGQKGQITENPDQKYAEGLDFILTAVALSRREMWSEVLYSYWQLFLSLTKLNGF